MELVYGIMVTGHKPARAAMAQQAIEDFSSQTYPDKELIVVTQDAFSLKASPGLRIVRMPVGPTLGELRNVALELVPKRALWIQWDDDDRRPAELIAEQRKRLGDASACVLRRQVQYSTKLNAAWVVGGIGIMGTIMCRANEVRYPALPKHEDSAFFSRYAANNKVILWDNDPHWYIRVIHGHNTWDESHFFLADRKPWWDVPPASVAMLEKFGFCRPVLRLDLQP